MIYQIPLQAVPVQKAAFTLGGQEITVSLLPRLGRLYATVFADGLPVVRERICRHAVPLANEAYCPLNGELFFIDTAGSSDPVWQELGSRFILVYRL